MDLASDHLPVRVILPPRTHQELLTGVSSLVDLIRPTLGPLPRHVFYSDRPDAAPQLLDCGGLIAKLMPLKAGDPQGVGAALLKEALTRMQDRVGDGTAAAAVMFEKLLREGFKFVISGGNPMLLRRYLSEGQQTILEALERQRTPLEGKAALARFADSLCHHAQLAQYLGEIFDIIGEWGRLEVVAANAKTLERDYVDGFYWEKGMVSRYMANHPHREEAYLENPAILVSNYYMHDPRPLVALLETAVAAGITSLLIVSLGFSEKVIGLFSANNSQGKIWVVGVTPPVVGEDRLDFIQDIAVITGATPVMRASDFETELTFSSLKNLKFVRPEHFGQARRAWVTKEATGISGGKADPRYLRHYLHDLQRRYERESDLEARSKLQVRLGKFLGGSATLWVGGTTALEIQQHTELAKKTALALRRVVRTGVVPGGGAALLSSHPELERRARNAGNLEERVAYSLLAQAVQEPTRVMLENAGLEAEPILARLLREGPGYGYDVLARRVDLMSSAGIYDGAAVTKAMVQTAVSSAALALTTDVILNRIPARTS